MKSQLNIIPYINPSPPSLSHPDSTSITTRPHLYIETQFSPQSSSSNVGHFQFQPKDVISQANSFQYYARLQFPIGTFQKDPKQALQNPNRHDFRQNKKLIVAGIVQLDFTVNSWKINAIYDAFSLIKRIHPRSFRNQRSLYPQTKLQQCKSVANLRFDNNLLNRRHQRKKSNSNNSSYKSQYNQQQHQSLYQINNQSERDLERAEVLNDIITKLNSREKSYKRYSLSKSSKPPNSKSLLLNSNNKSEKKLIIKEKLKKLENILKDYKLQHLQAVEKSTVYYTKHSNPGVKGRGKSKHVSVEESNLFNTDGGRRGSPREEGDGIKISTFKKLKNDIINVKSQVNQLKEINQVYRRENYILRNQGSGRESIVEGGEREREREREGNRYSHQQFGGSGLGQHPQTQYPYHQPMPLPTYPPYPYYYPPYPPQSYLPPPPLSYTPPFPHLSQYPTLYSPSPPNFNQTYSPIISASCQQLSSQPQPILTTHRSERCRDARHENFWKTMVVQRVKEKESEREKKKYENTKREKEVDKGSDEAIVFCFKCGYKCAEKDDKLDITERKDQASSLGDRFKDLY